MLVTRGVNTVAIKLDESDVGEEARFGDTRSDMFLGEDCFALLTDGEGTGFLVC
jgi:hypothetical protein